ncbi:MAG: ferrous iron transport protein A [Deltaproteobacteria bacterium]|nr:ferrous iron transport protein A [Deltaproteobacteria bacterium]
MTLDAVSIGRPVRVAAVSGARSFRRRIQELGLVPGTVVELLRIAPLGDPIELRARGCLLSIRRAEAAAITVEP